MSSQLLMDRGLPQKVLLWKFLSWAFVLCPLGISLGHLLRHRIDGSHGIGMSGLSGYRQPFSEELLVSTPTCRVWKLLLLHISANSWSGQINFGHFCGCVRVYVSLRSFNLHFPVDLSGVE